MSPLGRRALGLAFLCLIGLLVTVAVAQYNHAFTRSVPVLLETDHVGLQLAPPADVKLRGLIVGQVRGVRVDGDHADIDLALDPRYAGLIPAGVSARLLPKTLFGEKVVDLVPPRSPDRSIRAHDVIPQDRSRVGIEIERVLNDLIPLLRTIQPAKLNATLNALATALDGRGERLGQTLERLDRYLKGLNPHLGTLQADVTELADAASTFDRAAPDLLRVLRNLITTSDTVVAERATLDQLLRQLTGTAEDARELLADNERGLIQVGSVLRPTLGLLARYAPEYPCLLEGLARLEPRLDETFHGGALNVTLEPVRPRPAYRPGEEPRYLDHSGPACHGLPGSPPVPFPKVPLADGANQNPGDAPLVTLGTPAGLKPVSATPEEQGVVRALLAPAMRVPANQVPPVATLLFGPMARGTVVSVT
jgi:phospholipid/cholesterol/gamma-HCH transport system substrate-binding protein